VRKSRALFETGDGRFREAEIIASRCRGAFVTNRQGAFVVGAASSTPRLGVIRTDILDRVSAIAGNVRHSPGETRLRRRACRRESVTAFVPSAHSAFMASVCQWAVHAPALQFQKHPVSVVDIGNSLADAIWRERRGAHFRLLRHQGIAMRPRVNPARGGTRLRTVQGQHFTLHDVGLGLRDLSESSAETPNACESTLVS